ncbi:MAG: BCAM0308 family protein [bacterium]|nr:BCAM0308 family protein [bacterium]
MRKREHPMRGGRGHCDDPYALIRGYKEPTVCPNCGLVFHEKKWIRNQEFSTKLKNDRSTHYELCPACREIKEHYPMGIVRLKGDFWKTHKGMIENLIRNEETRGMDKNPLERIISIREEGDTLLIETTRESLASRIGKVMKRACKGNLKYEFSRGEKLVRIEWSRD